MTNREIRFELGRVEVIAALTAAPEASFPLPGTEFPVEVEAPACVRFSLAGRTLALFPHVYLCIADDDRGVYYGGVENGLFVREDNHREIYVEDARRLIALAAYGEEDDNGDVYAAIHAACDTLCWEAADVMGEALEKALEAERARRENENA